ncbi:hypothetical protein HM1_0549 [Heliomicrobium modesticaldum Ice1]|uniref:Uncharacterized protein n=1 Tax=Heliobacterium modesticaldum (strain ATCC 51547 / Ice1) TaxID=498761 RepID=B0TG06_HELMI|nr:hypothetical protein HM1_0549 [Heliomicrobium modesticaldum Ice1]
MPSFRQERPFPAAVHFYSGARSPLTPHPAARQDSLPTLLAVDLTSASKEMLLTDIVYVS